MHSAMVSADGRWRPRRTSARSSASRTSSQPSADRAASTPRRRSPHATSHCCTRWGTVPAAEPGTQDKRARSNRMMRGLLTLMLMLACPGRAGRSAGADLLSLLFGSGRAALNAATGRLVQYSARRPGDGASRHAVGRVRVRESMESRPAVACAGGDTAAGAALSGVTPTARDTSAGTGWCPGRGQAGAVDALSPGWRRLLRPRLAGRPGVLPERDDRGANIALQ